MNWPVYERLTGGCTRIFAAEITRTTSSPITASSYVLDNAYGFGIVSEQIKLVEPNVKILVADLSPVRIEQVPQLIKDRCGQVWKQRYWM